MKIISSHILMLVILLSISCEIFDGKKSTEKSSSKIVCILFDLSLSTASSDVRHAYAKDLKLIMKNMNPGDVMVGGLITEKSISELEFSIQFEFPSFKPTTDNILMRQAEARKFDSTFQEIKDSLQVVAQNTILDFNKRILKTEIMSALQVVERVFKSYPDLRRVLVVMSDMIEDSKFYNFYHENLTKNRIRKIIENEREQGRLPDLQNANVYVVGAMANNTNKFLNIRNFWIDYFKACGANLTEENYGTAMIKFKP